MEKTFLLHHHLVCTKGLTSVWDEILIFHIFSVLIPTPWEPQPASVLLKQQRAGEYFDKQKYFEEMREKFQQHLADLSRKDDISDQLEDYKNVIEEKNNFAASSQERHPIINLSDDFKLQSIGELKRNKSRNMLFSN